MNIHQITTKEMRNMVKFGSVKDHYSYFSKNIDSLPWYRDDSVISVVRKYLPLQLANLLDLCGGTGIIVEKLRVTLPDVEFHISDISNEMISIALQKFEGKKNVSCFNSDWIYSSKFTGYQFDAIIVKNSLHVVSNYLDRLDDLAVVSHTTTRLIVVETVSPSDTAANFVKGLFSLIQGSEIKKNYFTKSGLQSSLQELKNWQLQKVEFLDQKINITPWVEAKGITKAEKRRAFAFLLRNSYNYNIKKTMKITKNDKGVPQTMLRKQGIFVLTRK